MRIFDGATLVATYRRVRESCAQIFEAAHVAGLWRVAPTNAAPPDGFTLSRPRSLA